MFGSLLQTMFAGLAKRRSFDLFANKNVKLAERRNYIVVIGVDLLACSLVRVFND